MHLYMQNALRSRISQQPPGIYILFSCYTDCGGKTTMVFRPSYNELFPLRLINVVKKYTETGGNIIIENRTFTQLSKLQVLDFFFPGLFIQEIPESQEAEYDFRNCRIKAPRKNGTLTNQGSYKQKITEIEDCLLGNRKNDRGYRNFNAAHSMLKRAASEMMNEKSVSSAVFSHLADIYENNLNGSQKRMMNTWMKELTAKCHREEVTAFCTAQRNDGFAFDLTTYQSFLKNLDALIQKEDFCTCWVWICLGSLFGNYVCGLSKIHQNRIITKNEETDYDAYHLVSSPEVIVNPFFCGRDDDLKQIDDLFAQGKRVIFLSGISGIGKTEIARQYAALRKDEYDVIIYAVYDRSLKDLVIAEMPFETKPAFTRLLNESGKESDDSYFERKLSLIKRISDQKTLIIIDNYNTETDEQLRDLLNGRYRVLITTQYDYSGRYPCIKVKEIKDQQALIRIFMNNYQGYAVEKNDPDLIRLLHSVASHTYTIVLLAHHMELSGQTAEEMLEVLEKEGITSLNETITSKEGKTDTACLILTSMFKVFDFSNEEQKILKLLSLIHPENVPAMIFKEWADLPSTKSMVTLEKRGWIVRYPDGITLHSVVNQVVRHFFPVRTEEIRFFLDHISDSLAEEKSWLYTKAEKEQYCRIAGRIIDSVRILDEYTAQFFMSVTVIFGYSGYPEQAVRLGKELFDYFSSAKGLYSFETAHIAYQTGWIYLFNPHLKNAVEEALPWLQKAEEIFEHIELADAQKKYMYCGVLENTSKAYSMRYGYTSSQSDLDHARRYAEKAVACAEKLLTDYRETKKSPAGSLLRLADVYLQEKEFEKAEKLIDQAYSILVSLSNEAMNPDILRASSRKAKVLYYLGKYNDSLEQTEKNLESYVRFYALDNPSLFDQYILKIRNCLKLGLTDEAMKTKTEAEKIGHMIYTPDNPRLKFLDEIVQH